MQAFIVLLIFVLSASIQAKAPFIQINTVHQAYSQFEVNLILNENRNIPIIMLTYSSHKLGEAARDILQAALNRQKYGGFAIIIDCKQFNYDLNKTIGICSGYDPKAPVSQTEDAHFTCEFMIPQQTRIKDKGHILMKNHVSQRLKQPSMFTAEYLAEMIKKNIPDFVAYIEDEYDLQEFLNKNPQFIASKQPKVLYFDENLLAPVFLKKFASLTDGKMSVGVTDDISIFYNYQGSQGDIVMFQYNFLENSYTTRVLTINQDQPIQSLLDDPVIADYRQIKKNRDILLDFQHSNYTVYNFSQIRQIWNLKTHGRILIVELSQKFECNKLYSVANQFQTLFNYVCYGNMSQNYAQKLKIDANKIKDNFFMIIGDMQASKWVQKDNFKKQIYENLPKNSSRQPVSTVTEADHCLRTAQISKRNPIFYYFNQKTNERSIRIMNYLNSLPQVTSLLYFCQIYLPDDTTNQKFNLKSNTIFTLYDPNKNGQMKKMEHSAVQNFIQIKMFLRELSIQKMMTVYDQRLIHNRLDEVKSNQDLEQFCFNKNCIVGLIATGRYREEQQIKMLKQMKLQYEEDYNFVWIDGICNWDVPRQLKILKKKEKVIDRSYVFLYNQKQITFNLWQSTKFWNPKELNKWIKSLKNRKGISHLKFGIDIEQRQCKPQKTKGSKAKKQNKVGNEDL